MRRTVSILAGVVLLATLLLSFGSTADTEPPGPEFQTASHSATPDPVDGGSLKVGLPGGLQTLDPHQAATPSERMVARVLTDSLFRFDFVGGLQAGVVSRWEGEEDGLSYVLYLRPDLVFSDGSECDAEAVRDNLMRMREVGSPVMVGSWLSSIRQVEVIDDLTLRLDLMFPDPNLLFNLSRAETGLVSMQAVQEMGADFFAAPVGLGPFHVVPPPEQLESEMLLPLPDDQIQHTDMSPKLPLVYLAAFEDYWQGRAHIDSIAILNVDPEEDPAELLAGGFDLIAEVSPGYEIPEELGYTFTRVNLDHHLVALNLNSPTLADVTVRRALQYAVDRHELIEKVFGGDARILAIGDLPGGPDDRNSRVPGRNPAQAAQILDDAGYGEDGRPLVLNMLTDEDPVRVQVSELLAEQIRRVGFDVQLEIVPREAYYDRMRGGEFDLSYWVLVPGMVDCSAYTANLHSDSYWNVSQLWRYPGGAEVRRDLDDLLQQMFDAPDPGKRRDLYGEFARLADDQQLYLSLWNSEVRGAAVGRLRGLSVPYGFAFDLSRAWLHRP